LERPSTDTRIEVRNLTNEAVRVTWLTAGGKAVDMGRIAPSGTYAALTTVGHVWQLIKDDGAPIGWFVGERRAIVVVVR